MTTLSLSQEIRDKLAHTSTLVRETDDTALGTALPPLLAELHATATQLVKLATDDARRTALATSKHRAELDLLRMEINNELVDREANAARIAERQLFLYQRGAALPGQATAAERAVASASYVETALVSLCPHVNVPMTGCDKIVQS